MFMIFNNVEEAVLEPLSMCGWIKFSGSLPESAHNQLHLSMKLVDMRAMPISMIALRTFLKIIVVKAGERFQL